MKELEISEKNKKRLLKKWRWILTRYSKLRDNWFIREYRKWNTNHIVDCTKVKDWYLKEIENANKIITKLWN